MYANIGPTCMTKVVPDLRLFLLLIFLSLILLLVDTIGFLDLPKQAAFYITNPVSFGIYNTGRNVNKQFYFLFMARKAGQENKALKEQVGELFAENAGLRKQLAQMQTVVSQEKYLSSGTYNLLAARPIGLSRYLKIDKGVSSGVKVGQPVVFKDNLIGKIIEVSTTASLVQLLTDPDSKAAAFSQNIDGKAKGILVGQFGTEVMLDKILQEEKINEGDLVYSEGLEGFLPRGLVLGKVAKVVVVENEVFKQAKVQPIFNISDLELVFVMKE